MPKLKDIQGQVFGDLTALRHIGSDKVYNAIWMFQCICGKQVEYISKKVLKGEALSCGCRRYRKADEPKICKDCGVLNSTRRNQRGGIDSRCNKCYNKLIYAFRKKDPRVGLVISARVRAKKHNVPCDLHYTDLTIPEFCPILGIRLEVGTKEMHDASPSLDRIIPALGYVKGNIGIMSFRANRFKSDATSGELRALAEWIEANAPKIELVA